jgi:hypothetical protein
MLKAMLGLSFSQQILKVATKYGRPPESISSGASEAIECHRPPGGGQIISASNPAFLLVAREAKFLSEINYRDKV